MFDPAIAHAIRRCLLCHKLGLSTSKDYLEDSFGSVWLS